jgi:hypothetical protein
MQSNRYKTVNTFSRPLNANQIAACVVVVASLLAFFLTLHPHLRDNTARISLLTLLILCFLSMLSASLLTAYTDSVDPIIPIYLSPERGSLGRDLRNCLYCESCQSYVLETSRHCKACKRYSKGKVDALMDSTITVFG